MKIAIALDEYDTKKRWITLDGERWRQLHIAVWGRKPRIPRVVETEEELQEIFSKQEARQARDYALRRLSAQSYLSNDLRRLFKERMVSIRAADDTIEGLTRIGYLDDAAWIRGFVRRRRAARDGPRKIEQALRQKGVNEELIEEMMVDGEEGCQQEAIQQLLATRYCRRDLSDYKEKQKVIAALSRKGFDIEQIIASIEEAYTI